jgi:glycosyltransferase involved in cell wall biosynthesis
MKIAQIVCAYPPYAGGIGNSASQITRLLGGSHEVINFHPKSLRPWLEYGHGAFLPQLLWRLRSFDYLYLHYPFFGAAEIVWLYKLLGGRAKLIVHYHMDVKNLSLAAKILSLPSRLIRRALLKQAVIIVSASLDYIQSSQIKKIYARQPEKFREIPFGLDLKKFQPRVSEQPGDNKIVAYAKALVGFVNNKFIKNRRLDFLFVGALDSAHYFKGLDVLFPALLVLKTRAWHLTVVGDGNRRPDYEEQVRKLGLSDQISFTGQLGDANLVRAYQEADLLILPSINTNEAFGLVIIEALACGVPVIASNLPGVRRVFTDQQEGLLVEPSNAADLSAKLEYILQNEGRRQAMAKAARQLAEYKYDEQKMSRELLALIK